MRLAHIGCGGEITVGRFVKVLGLGFGALIVVFACSEHPSPPPPQQPLPPGDECMSSDCEIQPPPQYPWDGGTGAVDGGTGGGGGRRDGGTPDAGTPEDDGGTPD